MFGGTNERKQAWPNDLMTVSVHRNGVAKVQRSQRSPEGHQPDEQADVANPIDDECLVCRRRSTRALEREADQKPRTDTDQLPEDENHRQISSDHDPQHAETKQREPLEKSRIPPGAMQVPSRRQRDLMIRDVVEFVLHVADGIDVGARCDERHHHKQQHGQAVDVPADREHERRAAVERVPVA